MGSILFVGILQLYSETGKIMSETYMFKGVDSYDTPEEHPVSIWFKLFRRWYFYWINFAVFITCGKLGKKGKLDKDAQIEQSNRNFKLVEDCGGKIHLRGLEHLRALNGKPCVLVANHMSLLETAMVHSIAREYVDFSFVVKKSLYDVPYFKHLIGSLDAIAVGRSNPREDLKTVLAEGKRILLGGRSIIIFPQSTRSSTVDAEHFNSIGMKLAKSAGVPILPFALKTDFTKVGKVIRDMGEICPEHEVWYEFFPAMEIEGNGHEQHKQIIELISSRVEAWRKAENE